MSKRTTTTRKQKAGSGSNTRRSTAKPMANFERRYQDYMKAERKAVKIGKLPAAERRKLVAEGEALAAELNRRYREFKGDHAPSAAAVNSDVLAILMAVGAEFIARYYPTAKAAGFSIDLPGTSYDSRPYITIPMAVIGKPGAS